MKKRNILPRTLVLLFLLCGPGIALLVWSNFACGLGLARENSGTTSIALTIMTVPALKGAKTISTVKNTTTLLTATTDYNNPDINNSSGKTWHVVDAWTLGLTIIPLFPYKDLLQSLHDVFDKVDDGSDDPSDPDTKLRNNIQTVQKVRIRMSKRIHRIWKFLIEVSETLGKA